MTYLWFICNYADYFVILCIFGSFAFNAPNIQLTKYHLNALELIK